MMNEWISELCQIEVDQGWLPGTVGPVHIYAKIVN